jgi:DNA/RNA endonuclease YhcR with UshA esterase domain
MRLDDSGLLKIALGTSTIGLLLLFIVSSPQAEKVRIIEIDYEDVGNLVIIEGRVASKHVHEDGHIFLKVKDDTGLISTVVFASDVEKLEPKVLDCLGVGRTISVIGRVEEYRGALEIIPSRGNGLSCLT